MKPADYKLQQDLIRLIRGMCAAWEDWLKAQIKLNPDPVETFKELDKEIQQRRQ